MERSTYLLEIGTEELPASFLETAEHELSEKTVEALEKNRLAYGSVEVLYTPRRLALLVHDLAAKQEASEELLKGPPVSVALDAQGQPTPAAQGFARKNGIDVSDLKRETIDGTDYLVFRKTATGRTVTEILPEILPDVILGLSGSHFMAWDESDIRFSRPIRWLVSLYGNQHLPIQIGLVQSSTFTRGHRFFSEDAAITIPDVASYKTLLWQKGNVIVDQQERQNLILKGLRDKSTDLKGRIPEDASLLSTVTRLVETPALVAGNFETRFLSLPKEVITTVMTAHQKYFHIEDEKGALMPYFITISNNPQPQAEPTIREGNEKVLRARLEDASFFFQTDTSQPLENYVENLKGITFQKGLGSLYDKTKRVQALVDLLAPNASLSDADKRDAGRAALLCKADLATGMVRELTELQGIVGKHYAALSGEPEAVATAVEEHYFPRFMGDTVAQTPAGILLSLADKLDTMIAVFAQKDARYPTGSKDPMGLRRMALGIIQTILENKLAFNLDDGFAKAYQNLGNLAVESEADVLQRTRQFILQRFKGYLLDLNFSYDTIDAILESDVSPLSNLNRTIEALALLKGLQQDVDNLKKVYEPANRTSRILSKGYQQDVQPSRINPNLFEHDSEKALFETIAQVDVSSKPLSEVLPTFIAWSPRVEAFFDNVLVNAENPDVKNNRYLLLSLLNKSYRTLADFTKLVV